VRWLLIKDLQILKRSPLLVALLVVYPIAIALMIGFALSSPPGKPRVALYDAVPTGRGAVSLGSQKIDIAQKAGVDGRLFGSVTNADIAEGLGKATGVQVKKAEIRMPQGPLKHIGEFPIVLHLHADVEANIVVHVVAEA